MSLSPWDILDRSTAALTAVDFLSKGLSYAYKKN